MGNRSLTEGLKHSESLENLEAVSCGVAAGISTPVRQRRSPEGIESVEKLSLLCHRRLVNHKKNSAWREKIDSPRFTDKATVDYEQNRQMYLFHSMQR